MSLGLSHCKSQTKATIYKTTAFTAMSLKAVRKLQRKKKSQLHMAPLFGPKVRLAEAKALPYPV